VVHNETYHDYSPEDITGFYAEKESLPENLRFISENGKQRLAQVFTDIRYKKADNELFSGMLLAVLKQQGFISNEP
jgi:hypothetical protein